MHDNSKSYVTLYLKSYEQSDSLDRIVATINVITHKKVIRIR